jgi:flagellar biosynthesis/type III secretory pathway protein FliH
MPPLKLEVFESAADADAPVDDAASLAQEEARLASYDSGYGAGWEDAMAAQSGDQTRLTADLARNLQSLGFTYHEARVHVLRGVQPLLQDIVSRLLPELARETLAPVVLEVLMPLAEEMADTPVVLHLNPASRPAVAALLEQATGLPMTLIDEPALAEGQVSLTLGQIGARVDLDAATAQIAAAVHAFFDLTTQEQRHG